MELEERENRGVGRTRDLTLCGCSESAKRRDAAPLKAKPPVGDAADRGEPL